VDEKQQPKREDQSLPFRKPKPMNRQTDIKTNMSTTALQRSPREKRGEEKRHKE
jgi:hypothetical protein